MPSKKQAAKNNKLFKPPFKPVAPRSGWPHQVLAKALAPLGEKISVRYWLETIRLALIWGLAVVGVLLAVLWLYPLYHYWVAWGFGLIIVLAVTVMRFYRRPDALTTVHVADELGAKGAAITSYRLLEDKAADVWSVSAIAQGLSVCQGLGSKLPDTYAVLPLWRPWRDVAMLLVLIAVLQLMPHPMANYWAGVQNERQLLAEVARQAQQTVADVQDIKVQGESPLPDEIKKELAGLTQDVKKAPDRRQAAHELEKASWRLEEAKTALDTKARRDLNRLTANWGGQNEKQIQKLAGALQGGKRDNIEQAVQDLNQGLQKASEEQKKQTAGALLAGAANVEDASLQKALRNMAAAAQSSSSAAANAAANDLAQGLASMAETASAGNQLGDAATNLSALASGLLGLPSDSQALASASASSSAATSSDAAASSGATNTSADGCSNPSCTDGNCDGNQCGGSGSNGREGQGGSSGGNLGQGGSGAGTGKGKADLIYTPFLSDAGGEKSQLTGQVREGEQGSMVNLDRSPTSLGAVRPYTEVYGQYLAEANESLSRAPLPPEMENLVWRYFNSLNQQNVE